MDAHVTSTHFLPGVEVGLYGVLTRPGGPGQHEPLETKKVPKAGQVTFKVDNAGDAYWLAGEGDDGRWRVVQGHSKAGDPVDVRKTLASTRPPAPPDENERRVVGARGTGHRAGRRQATRAQREAQKAAEEQARAESEAREAAEAAEAAQIEAERQAKAAADAEAEKQSETPKRKRSTARKSSAAKSRTKK